MKSHLFKKTWLFLLATLWFTACEIQENNPEKPCYDFTTRILEGYNVNAIEFDRNGIAWIGTSKQGLIRYGADGMYIYNSQNSIISDTMIIYDLDFDPEGNLWIGAEKLLEFDGNEFRIHDPAEGGERFEYIQRVKVDSRGLVWLTVCIMGGCRLMNFDGSNWELFTIESFEGCPTNFTDIFVIDRMDNTWFPLTNNSFMRLACYTGTDWRIYTDQELDIGSIFIGDLDVNSKNKICGSIDYSLISNALNPGPDIFIFDGDTTNKTTYDTLYDIRSIFVDKQDNIWCINYTGGIGVFDGKEWYRNDTIFKGIELTEMEQSPDMQIWLGSRNGIYLNCR